MNTSPVPCKDCSSRNMTCHSTCERYLEWKSVSDKNREEVFKKRMADIDIRDFKANMKARAIKQRRKAGKIKRK